MAENKSQEMAKAQQQGQGLGIVGMLQPMKSDKPKVTYLRTQDGGVWLGPNGTLNEVRGEKSINPNGLPSSMVFDMELDRTLGGVVIRFENLGKTQAVLVPMGHVRQVTLAE
jgi:hypothetical protein